ncbi:TOMM precursor leader peptide-binding protein [Pseudonocardia endophytica]|uniref:Ribosomal protein S12 methylthiotransferase accessory factor n=1 Tax=Pseudonocardia endophytica TaxID=401976 RepID=A0A4R1HR13_PSEEN|nr:TOMM precursor leader peptide-binding protein [Pseudonocardia endophytica]TCK22199.1 ribosomal protein S12 methylthiotransferase accessory factor [Pseudonocardia endophytica]
MTSAPPRVRPDLVVVGTAAGRAWLAGERGITAVGERAGGVDVGELLALLDGSLDLAALAGRLGVGRERLRPVLDDLVSAGLVAPAPVPGTRMAEAAWWAGAGLAPADNATTLRSSAVAVVDLRDGPADGPDGPDDLDGALDLAGLRAAAPGVDAEMSVVLCSDYLDPRLAAVDADHRLAGRPWLLGTVTGRHAWIGPVFSRRSGCWHCLAHRLGGQRAAERALQAGRGHDEPLPRPRVGLPVHTRAALHVMAGEAAKWVAGVSPEDGRRVTTWDTLELTTEHHRFTARPQCPACGDPGLVARAAERPVALRRRPVADRSGGLRAEGPDQVWERYRHLVGPVTGVVREIVRDDRVPGSLHAWRSGPNLAAGGGLGAVLGTVRSHSGGKGVTAVQARTGALCEALERWSGAYQGDEPRIRAARADLGDAAVDPADCLLVDDRQLDGRDVWNAAHGTFQHVPVPPGADDELDWTPLWSLTTDRRRLLPTRMCYFGAPPGPAGSGLRADSNGCAAGASLEDAVLQGLLELVERDAVATWWYTRASHPECELPPGDPVADAAQCDHAALGRTLWALDLTSDLGVPVVAAVSRGPGGPDGPGEGIAFGFGAHPDPAVALHRALCELGQLLPAALAPRTCSDPDARAWWTGATLAGEPWLAPDPDAHVLTRIAPHGDDVRDVLDTVRDRVEAAGHEVLVLDQTRPDVGLPVVRVVAPGLRHFWARFAPGRLFDVPVRTGRIPAALGYDELNPVPMFL